MGYFVYLCNIKLINKNIMENICYEVCRVVMLSTDGESNLLLNKSDSKLLHLFFAQKSPNDLTVSKHLYILSNDEIKQEKVMDQLCMYVDDMTDLCCLAGKGFGLVKGIGNYYPIIATTDKTIVKYIKANPNHTDPVKTFLPEPSKYFVEQYADAYNSDNIIKTVLVEHEFYHGINTSIEEIRQVNEEGGWDRKLVDKKIIVNSDNTINMEASIKKEFFSREEVIDLINKFSYDNCDNAFQDNIKWLENNIPWVLR